MNYLDIVGNVLFHIVGRTSINELLLSAVD